MQVHNCWWIQQVTNESSLTQAIGNSTPGSIGVVRYFVVVFNYFSLIVLGSTCFFTKVAHVFYDEVARDNLSPKVCGNCVFLKAVRLVRSIGTARRTQERRKTQSAEWRRFSEERVSWLRFAAD